MAHKPGDEIKAKQAGYDSAYFDGIDVFGAFPDECTCEFCRHNYYLGFDEGLEALLDVVEGKDQKKESDQ